MKIKDSPEKIPPTVPKQEVFLCLPFNGNTLARTLTKWLSTAVERTFTSAKVIYANYTRVLQRSAKDSLSSANTSKYVYKFTCK